MGSKCCKANQMYKSPNYIYKDKSVSPLSKKKYVSPDLFMIRSPLPNKNHENLTPIYPMKCKNCQTTFYKNKKKCNLFCSKDCNISYIFYNQDKTGSTGIDSDVSYVNSSTILVKSSSL